ncbi:MAG: hypothetical protein LBQ43_04385 [Holosporales bacterium]|jgi:hypothetical protein|nr:hypothetical protein [Holosporales bacterium]
MSNFTAIAVSTCLGLVGVLFFASGYMMSRGLLYAHLPSMSKGSRTPSFNADEIVSGQGLTDLSEDCDEFAARDLESLAGLLKKRGVKRTPSPSVEKKKREPLVRQSVPYIVPFRWLGQ